MIAIQFVLNGQGNYSLNQRGMMLLLFVIAGFILIFLVWRRWQRWNFVLERVNGLQLEKRRTANLAERDTSRLELSESEIDTATLPDEELRRTRQG